HHSIARSVIVLRSHRRLFVRIVSSILTLAGLAGAAVLGSCARPQTELKQWDEIQAVTASVNELKAYTSDLESLVDSLQKVVARQDSALRIIVDFTGAQVPAYRGSE